MPTAAIVRTTDAPLDATGIGASSSPALYSIGGVRYQSATIGRVAPYVLGGVGVAHLKPTARFSYASGTLPDGSTPAVGDDVTTQLESAFDFSLPLATNAFMATVGGGVEVPLARHWAVDADYRFSRIKADTPLNAQGATFGIGYRF